MNNQTSQTSQSHNENNNKHRAGPRKKRIIPTKTQKIKIKIKIGQGFSSEIIASIVDLPVAVIKRYYINTYTKTAERQICMNCGKKVPTGKAYCIKCKQKAELISDDGMYVAEETCPSEMSSINIGK